MSTCVQLTICDLRDDCVTAIRNRFAQIESVKVLKKNITDLHADAWATAGNSFGDMGGGVDRAIDAHFSRRAQTCVQDIIRKEYFGELPVGSAVMLRPMPTMPALSITESIALYLRPTARGAVSSPHLSTPGQIEGMIVL
ncbi:MAG TPA: hypothetical protein VN281_00520 [Verrucomicrobiae bacterium]|nr:hypothetical protein [Verrucomicrobiae bacterium]